MKLIKSLQGTIKRLLGVAGGADRIGYQLNAISSLLRTQGEKNEETVSAFDFFTKAQIDDVRAYAYAQDVTAALASAVAHCVLKKRNLKLPAGGYSVSPHFPVGQAGGAGIVALQSYAGIEIYGEGRSTIVRSTSTDGGDVLQLNGVSGITFRDFSITGIKGNPASVVQGINGASVTNGGKNILLERVHAFDLPWVDKGVNGIDGGKGFTIQPGTAGLITDNIKVIGCSTGSSNGDQFTAVGFGMDVSGPMALSSTTLAPKRIIVRGNTFECWYQGSYVSLSDNGGANCLIPSMDVVIEGNTVIGAQYGVVLSRGSGVEVSGNRLINISVGAPVTYPTDTLRIPLKVISSYHCQISDNRISYAACNHFARVGGATHTTDGNSYYCSFVGNKFSGASAGNLWDLQNIGGVIAKKCVWSMNAATGFAGSELGSALLVDATYGNIYMSDIAGSITTRISVGLVGGLAAGDASVAAINGAAGFAGADGHTVHNTIFKNGNALAIKQTNSSAASAHVIEAQSNGGAVVAGFRNDGSILTAGAVAAASVTTVARVMPIYDAADTLLGYVPIYTTKA